MRPRHHLPVKLFDGRRFVWSAAWRVCGLAGCRSRRLLRLCAPAVELLAKLPHLLRRQCLDAAQKVIEIVLCHSPALRRANPYLSLV